MSYKPDAANEGDASSILDAIEAIELAGGVEGYQKSLTIPDGDLATTKIGLPQKTGVSITFFTYTILDQPKTIVTLKTDNGYTAAGWARGFNSPNVPATPIQGELSYLDMDQLTAAPCRWRIRPSGAPGGLDMVLVRGDVLLQGNVNFGFFLADAGVVGAFGSVSWKKSQQDASRVLEALMALELAGGSSGLQKVLALPDEDLATTRPALLQKTSVVFSFYTVSIMGSSNTLISIKTENGYIGAGWAKGFNSFIPTIPIEGELASVDVDRLVSEPCRWRIHSAENVGGLVMTLVHGAMQLQGEISLGLHLADAGAVGSYGIVNWAKV